MVELGHHIYFGDPQLQKYKTWQAVWILYCLLQNKGTHGEAKVHDISFRAGTQTKTCASSLS